MAWVDILPLTPDEVARLVTRRDRIRALQCVTGSSEGEPVDLTFAARLCFAKFLKRSGRLSEWSVKP